MENEKLENSNIVENNNDNDESTKKELINALDQISSEEYLKDFEVTGQYPELIKDAWREWYPAAILSALKEAWVNRVSSKEELLWFLPDKKHFEIWNLSHKHFWTWDFLENYSWEWRQECSDWSDLLTVLKWNGKYYLAKLACWEFNRKTFTEGVKRNPKLKLHKSEIPLFVVNQSDSYFWGKWTPQAEIRNIDVRLYLDLFTKIASLKKWEAELRSYFMEEKVPFDWTQIKIQEYEELKKILETELE